MYVREVGLNSTTFVTWDGKRMYYPNNVLSQTPIHNVRRSPNMSEKIGKLSILSVAHVTLWLLETLLTLFYISAVSTIVLNVDCYTPQNKIL